MPVRLFDAHNHLQDERLGRDRGPLMQAIRREGIAAMVVNGSSEEDWPDILELARDYQEVIPSFGFHPWYVRERSEHWKERLREFLSKTPSAIGEIGLDRWIKNPDTGAQEEVFAFQMQLACELELPASIHCLQAWGRLHDFLREGPRPTSGFVLHSFGGPVEMVPELARMGAYFSLPGYFAHERKSRQREAFKQVPLDRLLIETDAPDQSLPEQLVIHSLPPRNGKPVNHPANLKAVYTFASELLGVPFVELAEIVEANFLRVFGKLVR